MSKKISTFEKEMQDPAFKKAFDNEYKEFLLSEIVCALMEDDNKTVRGLAEEIGISPTVIQKLKSGLQDDIKLSNFLNLTHACGFNLILEKGKQRYKL